MEKNKKGGAAKAKAAEATVIEENKTEDATQSGGMLERLIKNKDLKGFQPSTLPQEQQDSFLKYVNSYLPKPTPENVFEKAGSTVMKFDYFITSYRIALIWAFKSFAKEKAEFAVKRRALADMKTDDPQVRGLMLLMCAKM